MFSVFPKTAIDIVAPDGTLRHQAKAILDGNSATIEDTSLTIEVGDEIRRKLPNGKEEAYEVLDPQFMEKFHAIPEHYQIKIRKKGVFERGREGNYRIKIEGHNARVNFHSVDNSYNTANERSLFENIAHAVNESGSGEERVAILEAIEDLQAFKADKPSQLLAYQKLIAASANHMTIIAPFLPLLSKFMGW